MSTKKKRKQQQKWTSEHGQERPQGPGAVPRATQPTKRPTPTKVRPTKVRPTPTLSQVEMVNTLNAALGTSYAVPSTETDARFLIDGMVDEERRIKRSKQAQ